jgi:hypothetical protein
VGKFDSREVTIGWVKNSAKLYLLGLTENLLPQIERNPLLEVLGPGADFPFDQDGILEGDFGPAVELEHMPSRAGG